MFFLGGAKLFSVQGAFLLAVYKRLINKLYLSVEEIYAVLKSLVKSEINKFEKEFAEYIGVKYALGTSYGRTAIYIALKAIDVQGKEVMVPALTCSVVRDAIVLSGAKPIFIDIDADTLNIKLDDIKKNLKKETSAIIPTHYYGRPCGNLEEIIKLAKENNIVVIEDCAHSLGADYGDKKVGNFGDMSIFSLTKNTLNFGGGMLCTNHKAFYERAKNILKQSNRVGKLQKLKDFYSILNYGYKTTVDKLVFDRVGKSVFKWWLIDIPDIFPGIIFKGLRFLKQYIKKTKRREISFYNVEKENIGKMQPLSNLKMSPIVASVGRVQLQKIDKINARRIKIAQKLQKKLPNYCRGFWNKNSNTKSVYTYFPFWFENYNIDKLAKECKSKGLLLRKSWPAFQEWWEEQDTENLRTIRDNLLMLTVNPLLTDREIDRAANVISDSFKKEQKL